MSTTELQVHPRTRFFTISTAGHVDHGKTSLIRRLTGIDPDRLKEEKERQMTTDLGFAHLQLDADQVLGFVDVPGHGKFLKNMLAGVGGIDLALLVVSADEGPMPQTRQHVRILSLLGITRAVAAITKTDMVDAEQVEIVRDEVRELLKQHGIEQLESCPVSSTTGTGFDELKTALKRACAGVAGRDEGGDLFFPVDRVFSKAGFGTVITGTLVSGKLAVGDQVTIEPGAFAARVRRLETFGHSIDKALPGQRLACNLVVKENDKLARGHVILRQSVQGSKLLIISLFDRPQTLKEPLSDRLSDQPVRLYHGTAEYHGHLRWVEDIREDDVTGQQAVSFLSLQTPGIVSAQDRFVIRLTDDTIYGGVILLRERPKWLTKSELLKLTDMLRHNQFADAVLSFITSSPQLMVQESQLAAILDDAHRTSIVEQLKKSGKLVTLGDYLLPAESRKTHSEDMSSALRCEFEKLEDKDTGVSLETLRLHLRIKLERTAFQLLVDEEAAAGRLRRKGDKVFPPGDEGKRGPAMAPALVELEQKVREQLANHWCLEWDELAEATGSDLKNIKAVVNALTKSGDVVIAGYDFVASAVKVKEAHQILADIWLAKRSIAPTDFREKLNTTRKYAMALLQYFDDSKITRRLDSGRVLLKGPR